MFRRRFFCTHTSNFTFFNHKSGGRRPQLWPVKQVTKSNFSDSLNELNNHIINSDFVAVSLQSTGSYSSRWHRILPFDTAETAYLKAKYAAEKFQILQFAVCPFSVRASNKLTAHPFNFHLFPRDEFKLGMPCYSFSCQPSYLASMAKEDFDFNKCIYDGISYVSRAQELEAKRQIVTRVSSGYVAQSSPTLRSVADNVFVERIKSRVGHWIKACRRSHMKTDDALVSSLRKLILGGEDYGSRPSLNIDVCSERQVQLVFEMVKTQYENVVPLVVAAKGGGTQSVRVVLTSSKEDRILLEKELQDMEDEQSKHVRGFREVIDLISASQKPVVTHNSLNDFTFIHSKFLSPLPPTMDEFRSSLHSVFPDILDVNHLMKEVGPLNNYSNNLPAAMFHLKRKFFAPIDIEIPQKASVEDSNNHGHNVVRVSELFAKLCFILKISPETKLDADGSSLKRHLNVFNLDSDNLRDSNETDDISIWTNSPRKISINNLVFLWGFRNGTSAGNLKNLLCKSSDVLSDNDVFDVRLVDKNCAVIVFWKNGLSKWFIGAIGSGDGLRELAAHGLIATGYESYKRVCNSEILGSDLAGSLEEVERVLEDHTKESAEVYWNNELMINFDDL